MNQPVGAEGLRDIGSRQGVFAEAAYANMRARAVHCGGAGARK
jgi:hypothetical protein